MRNEGVLRENVTEQNNCSFLPFLSLESKLLFVVLEEECPCEEIKS